MRSAVKFELKEIEATVGTMPSVTEINGTRNVDWSVFKCGICRGVNRFLGDDDCILVYTS